MSVTPKPTTSIVAKEAVDCNSFTLYDSTGTYDASTNPGGYGAPNIASSAVTQLLINVYPDGFTVPYVFTFTIVSNVISALTVTAPNGTITNIFADLVSNVWPFTSTILFTILNSYLGFTGNTLVDGHWIITYVISGPDDGNGNPFSVTTSTDKLFVCNTCICVKKLYINLDPDCNCSDSAISVANKSKALLEAAKNSEAVGIYDEAAVTLKKAQEICVKNCKSC